MTGDDQPTRSSILDYILDNAVHFAAWGDVSKAADHYAAKPDRWAEQVRFIEAKKQTSDPDTRRPPIDNPADSDPWVISWRAIMDLAREGYPPEAIQRMVRPPGGEEWGSTAIQDALSGGRRVRAQVARALRRFPG